MLLFAIGLTGWGIFYRLHLPVAPLLGTMAVLTMLRAIGLNLPFSAPFLLPLTQGLLGLYVGTKVTKEAVRDIKNILGSAVIIVLWSLTIIFVM